jgi:hypothetical protein
MAELSEWLGIERTILAKMLPVWRAALDKVVEILGWERWSNLIRDFEQVRPELQKQ